MSSHATSEITSRDSHGPQPATYFLVFTALIVLTLLTVGLSFLQLGRWHLAVGIAIGIIKALLVVLFFMHVLYSSRLTWIVIIAGLFWTAILIGGLVSDYLTRAWLIY